MRGVISLAAALSLPEVLADGRPFPRRNLILFLTFSVILVTLVLQGLTLPWLIRILGLSGAAGLNCEEQEARRIVLEKALQHVEEARRKDRPEFAPIYDDLAQHYRQRLAVLAGDPEGEDGPIAHDRRARDLERELLRVERDTAVGLRDAGRINDEVLRQIERDLDLREARLLSPAS